MAMNRISLSILYTIAALVFISCNDDGAQQAQQIPKVKVVDIIKKDVPVYREFVGEVSGLFDIPIRARVDGYLLERHFTEGSKVKKGQLLYVIDAQPYIAEVASKKSEVAEAQTLLVNAENELNRIEPLAKKNAVSQSDLDAAIAEKGAAEASLDAAKARLELAEINLGYTRISSPINGVIGKTKAKRGEYVGKDPNPVILNTVSRIDTVLVQFFLTESTYLTIAREYLMSHDSIRYDNSGREREDNLELILTDGSVHEYKGNVDFIDRNIDPTTGSILLQASFPNPKGIIRPGQFSKVKIEMRVEKDAMLVPVRCIMDLQGKTNVYVVKDDGFVELREVKTVARYGDLALVESGISHGEKILIEGIQFVRSGVQVEMETIKFESQSPNSI